MPSAKSNSKPSKAKLPQAVHQWSFAAIGTQWWIGVFEALPTVRLESLKTQIAARIEEFDKTYSRFRADSLITRIAKRAGTHRLPADSEPLLAFYRRLYELSGGLVTPLVGQLLADAGYDAQYSLTPGTLSLPPEWDDVLQIRGSSLAAKRAVLLDVGAAGKGYLVDIISQLLFEAGVRHFCVDAGGDMYVRGVNPPLRVGLEHPTDPGQAIGVATLSRGALCGSAGNRRAWGVYHHIMNPKTLRPVVDIQAVWVAAADAMTADGLATALFFMPPAALLLHFSFAYCLVHADNSVECSADFPAELFA
ncbi:MAG TPA: FAD:protein FMN transferase [Patescibacteria group bacterium]|nr:FAD:protein FMN transferase [Patescibacteria group bacterium]